MKQIRNNVFETNSSMTHCLVICKADNYNNWVEGKLMFKMEGEQFLETSEALKENAKQLRENLKWYEQSGRDYDKEKFNEDIIAKYERGEIREKWALFSKWSMDSYFITNDEFLDYVWDENYESVAETSNVEGNKLTVFGYYGHD